MNPAEPAHGDNQPPAEKELPPAGSSAPGAPPASRLHRLLAYRLLFVIALLVLGLDQFTKSWIGFHLPYGAYGAGGGIEIIPHFFYLVHVGNTGAAWSMFTGRSVVLALLAASTLVAIFVWRRALGLHDRVAQVCFGLLCGGIAGNLIDRLLHGYVVDFIDLHFGSYIYPTFNVADSGICVGVVLYLWHSFRESD